MKIIQLVEKLNKLMELNPSYADLEIKWYDDVLGHLSHGDGWPIQLFSNIYTKEKYCVLNSIHNPPAFGFAVLPVKAPEQEKNA